MHALTRIVPSPLQQHVTHDGREGCNTATDEDEDDDDDDDDDNDCHDRHHSHNLSRRKHVLTAKGYIRSCFAHAACLGCVQQRDLFNRLKVDEVAFVHFLKRVEAGYSNSNPYHNR